MPRRPAAGAGLARGRPATRWTTPNHRDATAVNAVNAVNAAVDAGRTVDSDGSAQVHARRCRVGPLPVEPVWGDG